MEKVKNNYRTLLKAELEQRCHQNLSYSLRSFAKALSINPGMLSDILNKKRPLSFKMAQRILPLLQLDSEQAKCFIASVIKEQKGRKLQRVNPLLKDEKEIKVVSNKLLDNDHYSFISSWHYAAIMEMTYSMDFKKDPKWIASQLGITEMEAKLSLERLLGMGLLKESNGVIEKTYRLLKAKNQKQTTAALIKKQKEIRLKAIDSLLNDPLERRSMTTVTMNIDPELIPLAKKMINEFNESLCLFLESKSRKKVYALEIGLFPLQK